MVPGTRVKHWEGVYNGVGLPTSATVIPVVLDKTFVVFHWVNNGDGRIVQHSVTVGGRQFTKTTKFDVARPHKVGDVTQAIGATATTGVAGVLLEQFLTVRRVAFGSPFFGVPGIEFEGNADNDLLGGKLQWVQLRTETGLAINSDGTQDNSINAGVRGLDTQYPAFIGNNTADTPELTLQPNWRHVEYRHDFTMYLMYRPEIVGAIWVPVLRVDWHWAFVANSADGNLWTLVNNSISHSINPVFTETTVYPEWDRFMFD